MTEDALFVDEIDIVRAPGFDTGGFPVEELSSGINVVHGPNASGKTTLARSTQWLLWPEEVSGRASVTGHLSLNGDAWRVEADSGRVTYQRNGQDANGPNLPPADQRDRYLLSLHDLLQHETRNETFAQAIKRESAGGYDLSAAREDLGFDDSPSTRRKGAVRDAEEAIQDWREAKRTADELKNEENRLAALRSQLDEAKEAKERYDLLKQAIEYARARTDLEEAEAKLETFPDILSRIDGDEAGTVDDYDDAIEEWQEKRRAAREKRTAARDRLAEADLPDEGVPTGVVGRLKELRDDLDSLEDRRDDHEATLADAERRRKKALQDIPLEIEEGALEELDPGDWKAVDEFARSAENIRAERQIQAAVEKWLDGDEQPDAELSSLQRGSQALENWLANPPVDAADGDSAAFRIAVVSALLVAIAGVALGLLIHPVLYASLLLSAGLLWYGYRARSGSGDDGQSRRPHRESFQQAGLELPTSWTEDEVRRQLKSIYDSIAANRLAEQRERLRETLEADLEELERRERSLDERRAELRDRIGAVPDTTDVELTVTMKGVLRWQEAHSQVLGLREKIDAVEAQIERTRGEIQETLDPYGYDGVDAAADATEHIRNLERRIDDYDEATREIAHAEGTIDEASETVEMLESERNEILTDLGLDSDERERLQTLCGRADEFRAAIEERNDARLLAENEADDLEAMPGYEPALEDRDVSDLERAKREAEETAADYDDIRDEITEIETRIDDAKQSNDVEIALAEKKRALGALRDQLDEDYASMVGDVLTEHVREANRETGRPAVFRHAREVLARITKGRYRLDLDEAEDTFRAYDTVKEKGFALNELSSATRLQVLLAVRIAFVEQHEQGVQLPLLLDEMLANTDDGKAGVIIESMIELAREGRQVFYFTAQGDEVAKWLTALDEAGDVDHAVVDLTEVRSLDGHVDVPDLGELYGRTPSPPDPEGHDHTSYGEALDVPTIDPRQGAGQAHLWYLVEDVDLLHHLLELGIERWGQLDNLLARTSGETIADDPDVIDKLECNGQAVEEFVRCWKRGRGERVDRQVLETSGAVSGTFIGEVTKIAEEVDGNAERIVEALRDGEVDRFRSGKMDELERYFEDNGYIESTDPLEPEQIRIRVVDCLVTAGVPRDRAKDRGDELLERLTTSY